VLLLSSYRAHTGHAEFRYIARHGSWALHYELVLANEQEEPVLQANFQRRRALADHHRIMPQVALAAGVSRRQRARAVRKRCAWVGTAQH